MAEALFGRGMWLASRTFAPQPMVVRCHYDTVNAFVADDTDSALLHWPCLWPSNTHTDSAWGFTMHASCKLQAMVGGVKTTRPQWGLPIVTRIPFLNLCRC
jgi:hypothetical protein